MIVDVINLTKKNTLCRAKVANSFLSRAIGLMFASPKRETGLLIEFSSAFSSRSIHSFFMRFPVDLIFIDDKKRVIEVRTLEPWRIITPEKPCHWVLEVKRGKLRHGEVELGDCIEFRNTQGPG